MEAVTGHVHVHHQELWKLKHTHYLQLQNPLLNAASNDEACHMDGLVLTQPVDPVLRLLLHSWIPPVTTVGKVYTKNTKKRFIINNNNASIVNEMCKTIILRSQY